MDIEDFLYWTFTQSVFSLLCRIRILTVTFSLPIFSEQISGWNESLSFSRIVDHGDEELVVLLVHLRHDDGNGAGLLRPDHL
jgi:hypothetical protein